MEKRFSIRRFSNSDVRGIVQLLNVVCKPVRPFNEDWWAWKYQKNPVGFFGEQGDVWIAEDQGKIVGHYAVIPIKVKIGKETMAVGQSVDTAVHPEYRRMGVFSTLAKNTYADIVDRYPFLFGFPSEMAYKGFLGLGWKSYEANEMIRIVDGYQVLNSLIPRTRYALAKKFLRIWQTSKRLSSVFASHKLEGENVILGSKANFGDEMDDFWSTRRNENTVVLERTSSFLNWRFSKFFGDYEIWIGRSSRDGRLLGYLVVRQTKRDDIGNVLYIVDMFTLWKEEKFIQAAIDLCVSKKNIALIRVRVPFWHKQAQILSRNGFIKVSSLMRRVGVSDPRLIMFDFKGHNAVPKVKEWFYSLGDTDYA